VALSFVYSKNPTRSLKWALTLTALVAVLPVQDWFKSELALNIIRGLKVALLTAAMIFTLVWVWSSTTTTVAAAQQKLVPPSTTATADTAQQKPAPPSPQSQAQLEERVKELEKRLDAAQQKAESAAMEKDYIARIQKQYEAYYEKAFNAQVWTLTILGLILTALFIFAGVFSFNIFDRRIDMALREKSAELRAEFAERLANETNALQEAHASELKTLEQGFKGRIEKEVSSLEVRSGYAFEYSQGLSFGVAGEHVRARRHFRWAVETYAKSRESFPPTQSLPALVDLFRAIQFSNPQNFADEARKELADDLYNGLANELNAAATELDWLAPLLNERN
jgi:hypothetical protein